MQHLAPETVDALVALAREAGAAIRLVAEEGRLATRLKADDSPVTRADLASHRILCAGLERLLPELPVCSEEADDLRPPGAQCCALLDPLDGTKSFVAGSDDYVVNIGIVADGLPIWGLVHAPVSGRLWGGGTLTGGAWEDLGAAGRVPIRVASDEGAWRALASRNHRDDREGVLLDRLPEHEVERQGSALKLCLIACGEADIAPRFGPTCLWDTAAPHAILLAAGGHIRDFAGHELRYDGDTLINPAFIAHGPPLDVARLCAGFAERRGGGQDSST